MAELKFRTQKARLQAIFDAYYELNGRRPVTIREVTDWALSAGLYPVPTRGDSAEDAAAFEERLQAAIAGWSNAKR